MLLLRAVPLYTDPSASLELALNEMLVSVLIQHHDQLMCSVLCIADEQVSTVMLRLLLITRMPKLL